MKKAPILTTLEKLICLVEEERQLICINFTFCYCALDIYLFSYIWVGRISLCRDFSCFLVLHHCHILLRYLYDMASCPKDVPFFCMFWFIQRKFISFIILFMLEFSEQGMRLWYRTLLLAAAYISHCFFFLMCKNLVPCSVYQVCSFPTYCCR